MKKTALVATMMVEVNLEQNDLLSSGSRLVSMLSTTIETMGEAN